MSFKVNNQGIFVNASNVRLRDKDLPCLRWGDDFAIVLVFPNGTIQQGDTFALAVDTDRFLGNGLCALSEDFTFDVATQTVSFAGVATNTQKMLSAVNGKPGCVEGQIQVTRYVNGDISQRVTILDDRCMMKGLVYVNGATVYILDPNAAYTKEQVDAIFATAVVFQFSADGVNWHDEQSDDDFYLRFRNPAVETSSWSNPIRFMRSDIVPLVTRAENAATNAERQAENAAQSANAANAAKNAAVEAKGEAEGFTNVASQMATAATENANAAVLAKNAASHSANAASNAANAASNSANDANNAAVTANNHKNAASDAANRAAGSASDANQFALDAKDAKDKAIAAKSDVQTMKQDVVEAANTALNSKTAAVNAANTAAQKATDATNAANTAAQKATDATNAANTAAQKATDATNAANTAAQKATDATNAANTAQGAQTAAGQFKAQAQTAAQTAAQAAANIGDSVQTCQTLKNQTQAIYDSVMAAVSEYYVGPAYNYGVTVNGTVLSFTWTDPADNNVVKWARTRLVMKQGGFPANETDGTMLVDETVRNTYKTDAFTWNAGVTSDYYFALFTQTTAGKWYVGDDCPRFTSDALTLATVAMLSRSGSLLTYPGMEIGSVLDIPVNTLYPKLRYKLAHIDYTGSFQEIGDYMYDNTRTHNSIWIPNYLPCLGVDNNNASMMPFDAPETSYGVTWDTEFVPGKAYYTVSGETYTQLTAGTDYQDGESVADWQTLHGNTVYTKNHNNRVSSGNNIWKESNMRQWLNSSGNDWFVKQNEYDVKSGNTDYRSGWMTGFVSGFLDLVMPVYNKTARNTTATISGGGGGGYDMTLDKFWLPSLKEFNGSNVNNIAEGSQFAYFRDVATTNAQRIQYDEGGTARYCWLRSPGASFVSGEYTINASGASNHSVANNAYAFLPAMCIA
jgi:hypothetical protein